jgi:class 3 adenylate cyclase
VIYYDQGSHDKALDYYLKSLGFSEKLNDPVRICTALVNIGGVYTEMNKYDQALLYYQKIEPYLGDLNNINIESTYLMGIGEVYSKKESPQRAIEYYKEALNMNKDSQDYAHILTMIAMEEFKLGEKEKAIINLNLAYDNAIKLNLPLDQVQTLLALGNVQKETNPNKALLTFKKAEIIANELETKDELRDLYQAMSAVYFERGSFKNAYLYQEKYLKLKDQIFNIETSDKIRGLQFNFDIEKKQDEIVLLEKKAEITDLQQKRQKSALYTLILTSAIVLMLAIGLYRRYRFIQKTNVVINEEKNRAEDLLLNILPYETAKELQKNGKVKAKRSESVTVMFTDFKSFTKHSENLTPEALVKSVDFFFSRFDIIIEKYGLEKIKTIGDAYMCAGGLPFPLEGHAIKVVNAAFDILDVMEEAKQVEDDDISHFDIRIGINTGPVVAGVVGIKKFAYDIWGDTVNIASRMESASTSGRINISANTYELIKDHFICKYRGEIEVKNRGIMKMYFVNGKKDFDSSKIVEKSSLNV